MCAPPLVMKEPCVACVCVCVWMKACYSPTTYSCATRSLMLQLFPATHLYLPVSSVVTSVINREPLGIFWNLETRKVQMRAQVWSSDTQEKQERRRGGRECIQLNILQSSTPKCFRFYFYLPRDKKKKKKNSSRPTPINVQTSLFHADERCPSTSRCRNIR